MGALRIRVGNSRREPLDDKVDVHIISTRTDAAVSVVRGASGSKALVVTGLTERQPYLIKVFPVRHRPVAQFAYAGPDSAPALVQLHAPIDPERVERVTFPDYTAVDPDLQRVLDRSSVEGIEGQGPGLYRGLTDLQKAGLFNLFGKMDAFGFDDHRTVWTHVQDLFRVRGDRIFAHVDTPLRDLVKGAVATGRCREVSGSLHTPPQGCVQAGSFKTSEQYGNLQLTFFVTATAPLAFSVDADIDDAAGLGHAFQVMRNFLTKDTTHPYDIHEILVYRQEVALPYTLA